MYTRIPKKTLNVFWLLSFMSYVGCTVKPLNSGHLCALKKLTVIKRCPLLGRYLKKKVTFRTIVLSGIQVMSAIWDVCNWEVSQYTLYPIFY